MKEFEALTIPVEKIDEHIVAFMTAQTVMSIATVKDNAPHCAMCFYVFVEGSNAIVFKSKPTTMHVAEGLANSAVAGTILPDKLNPGKTSGIQFKGVFGAADPSLAKHYYKKYPFAAVMPGELWMIELSSVVFTDATLGMGKKRKWESGIKN
jgi:uncharacterized protein YhbP (UPF0306 family)